MGTFSLSSNPLFCSIVTLYILILLYFPPFFLKLAISPTLISTIILLLFLLRLGTSQQFPSLPQQKPSCANLVEGQVEPSRLEAQPSTRFEKGFRSESESKSITLIARECSQLHTIQEETNGEAKPSKLESQPTSRFNKGFQFEYESESKESSQIDTSQEEANGETKTSKLESQPSSRFRKGVECEPESITFTTERSYGDTNQEKANVEPHCTLFRSLTTVDPNIRPDPKGCDTNARQGGENKAPGLDKYCSTFVEWDVRAPLEIIYEAYEGEEDEEENQNDALNEHHFFKVVERYTSLSCYYSDTDTDTDTDSSEEGEREGLIEIALDYYGYNYGDHFNNEGMMKKKLPKEVEVDDEDNLIEIDISPTRSNEFYW